MCTRCRHVSIPLIHPISSHSISSSAACLFNYSSFLLVTCLTSRPVTWMSASVSRLHKPSENSAHELTGLFISTFGGVECAAFYVFCRPSTCVFYGCRFVVCVEHDLSVLDYLSDYVCVLWGTKNRTSICACTQLHFA